jgi:hypothetical protein
MKTARLLSLIAFVSFLGIFASAQQANPVMIEIAGDIPQPRTYHQDEWKALRHVSISATNAHDKKTATYAGVAFQDLLKNAGMPSGDNLRGKALAYCIVVTANDGYQVTFSIAELDESLGNLQVLVSDNEDGKPLGQNIGPLRLVVPADKRPARWVRMVKTIRVVANPSPASPQ